MKQFLLGAMAFAAAVLLVTSCSKEEPGPNGDEGSVTFTAQLPGVPQTRAIGDGTTATRLTYAVYAHGSTTPLITDNTVTFTGGRASLSLQLAKGKSYDILFWADAPDSPYTFDAESQSVTADYENATANDEGRDAFFHAETDLAVEGNVSKQIELKRPFAQLNIVTNDKTAAGQTGVNVDQLQTKVAVKEVCSTLNLLTGEAGGTQDVTFGLSAIPSGSVTVKDKAYDYLSMNYILTGKDKALKEVTFTYDDGAGPVERQFGAVPVQRNYRTNIYGSLLTNAANFDITINAGFEGDSDLDAWDGNISEPEKDGNDYLITKASELAYLAQHRDLLSSATTIKLMNDINLANVEWTPVGSGTRFSFDGQGYTVYNLKASGSYASLLGNMVGQVSNVNVEGVSLEQGSYMGGVIGAIYGNIENCHVKDLTITNDGTSIKCGGLVGFIQEGNFSVKNCSVENARIEAYHTSGGLIGYLSYGTHEISGCSVRNSYVDGYRANSDGYQYNKCHVFIGTIGKIQAQDVVTLSDNTVVNSECDYHGISGTLSEPISDWFGDCEVWNAGGKFIINGTEIDYVGVEQANEMFAAGATSVNITVAPAADAALVLPNTSEPVEISLPGISETVALTIKYTDGAASPANLGITAASVGNLVIETPNTTVTLNGGTYVNVSSTTADNTLIVGQGVTIENLIVKAGSVDIFGAVANLTNSAKGNEIRHHIATAEEFRAFALNVNGGSDYKGRKVVLDTDIDLGNMEWTPIGRSGKAFSGVFDGQGHIVSNLKISGNNNDVGLFGYTTGGEVRNFTLHNAEVKGYLDVGAVAGTPYTSKYTDIRLTGTVKVDGFAYVGGMFGKNAYANLTNLTIEVSEGSYVKAASAQYRTYVGGVVGFMGEGKITVSKVSSNIDVTGSTCDVGGITGIAHYGNTFEECTCTGNVTLVNATDEGDHLEIGGIAGVWHDSTGQTVTFRRCSFSGTLSTTLNGEDRSGEVAETNKITGRRYGAGDGQLIIE